MKQQREQQTDVRKQTRKPDKRKSPTGPPPGPIQPRSVVPKEVVSRGDAPSQGHRRWCGILCVFVVLAVRLGSPLGGRPFLPLYPTRSMSTATFSLPSILLLRLIPYLPARAVVMFILGLVECAPSSGACWVRWFVVNTKFHRLVANLVGLRYLTSAPALSTARVAD